MFDRLRRYMKKVIIFIFLLSIYICTLSGCNTQYIPQTITIDNLSWSATADIQEWKTVVKESGWELPEGAKLIEEKQEVKSYKIVGYETKYRTEEYQEKIGYILPTWRPRYETRTRTVSYQVPKREAILATKYYYTIDKWVHLKYVHLAEGYTNDYTVPEYNCKNNEQVGEIKYKYLVHFTFNGEDVAYVVDKEFWESLSIGHQIKVYEDENYKLHINWCIEE